MNNKPKPTRPERPATAHDLARVEYRVKRSDGRLIYIERQLNLILKAISQGNPAKLQQLVDQVKDVSAANVEETSKIKQALEAQKE